VALRVIATRSPFSVEHPLSETLSAIVELLFSLLYHSLKATMRLAGPLLHRLSPSTEVRPISLGPFRVALASSSRSLAAEPSHLSPNLQAILCRGWVDKRAAGLINGSFPLTTFFLFVLICPSEEGQDGGVRAAPHG
jgi:hypothetical protein